MTPTYAAFDASAYLDDDEVIAEYLSAAAEDPNPDVFVTALGDVAKARGCQHLSRHQPGWACAHHNHMFHGILNSTSLPAAVKNAARHNFCGLW